MIEGPLRKLGLAVACLLAVTVLAQAPSAVAQAPTDETTAASATAQSQSSGASTPAAEIDNLADEVHEIRTLEHWVLGPIGVLVAILALGGGLGVVFSIRDQRRVSQLHELTIGSETLSQRRAEQGYASFLEQSQTTLALVNDTLRLAKEGSDRAASSMELKAKSQIDAIEERAERLMFEVFGSREFHAIVDQPGYRGEVHDIGEALRALEGYVSLQNISLPHNTKFVRAIYQFLLDDTEAALRALLRISQAHLPEELRRFTLYWLGYLYTTVGAYEPAGRIFLEDESGLSDYSELFQLDHMIAETKFFEKAKSRREDAPTIPTQGKDEPRERFEAVALLLDELSALADSVAANPEQQSLKRVRLEIARTRADVYTWIAYDPARIHAPIEDPVVKEAERIGPVPPLGGKIPGGEAEGDGKGQSAIAFMKTSDWVMLSTQSPDVFQAWALIQARAICEAAEEPGFEVAFALGESHFMLGDGEAAVEALTQAENALGDEFGEHREKRKKATLRQSSLICHRRLLYLKGDDEERRQVTQAISRAHEAANAMRPGRVTVFSQLQRCNVSQEKFKAEIKRMGNLEESGGPPKPVEAARQE